MRKWDQDETAEAGERLEKLYGREEAMEIDSRKLKDHPDVPGESRMEGTRANLGIKIGPDVTVGSVQGSPKRSVNIHCDPNWWARLFHWSSSCSCIRHYLDESVCGVNWRMIAEQLGRDKPSKGEHLGRDKPRERERCLGRDKPRGRLRKDALDETNQGED